MNKLIKNLKNILIFELKMFKIIMYDPMLELYPDSRLELKDYENKLLAIIGISILLLITLFDFELMIIRLTLLFYVLKIILRGVKNG